MRTTRALIVGLFTSLMAAVPLPAQAPPDSARCDQIVGSARVDSVPIGLFVSVRRFDGYLRDTNRERILANVAAGFIPPVPLRLSVFAGPVRTHVLRPLGLDTLAVPRAPTITGVYRATSRRDSLPPRIDVIRSSLLVGFDSAVTTAITASAASKGLYAPPADEDSMKVDIRFSTDSTHGATRLLSANFPRLPVVDAVPFTDNPAAEFPEAAKADSLTTGEVVLRFVVDRNGRPAFDAIEIVRASAESFTRAALAALGKQRFRPATVKGCPVAQEIDYPFTFVLPSPGASGRR